MNPIKVILVDDHDAYRVGIRTILETRHPDITVVGEAKYGDDFFDLLETTTADIVLLDIDFKFGMNGVEIARRLKKDYPEMKIIALSGEDDIDTVKEMVDTGIEGFVSKIDGADISAVAVRAVMQGTTYFGNDIAEIISRVYVAKKKTTDVTPEFTEQERRVIELCHEGLIAKEIGERLGITLRTVDWHKSNIFKKLGINNTAEMLNYALKHGIIRIK